MFGDALANLLAFAGYDVTREYYINDAGAQVDVLARSAFLRYREALGENIGAIPEGLYPGDYLKPVGGAARRRAWARSSAPSRKREWLPVVRAKAIAMMMDMIRDDLAALNVRHDVFFSERSLIEGGKRPGRGHHRVVAGERARSMKAACRRRKAAISRIGKTASRRCSARPISATTSTGR